jgi:hypothetical protein
VGQRKDFMKLEAVTKKQLMFLHEKYRILTNLLPVKKSDLEKLEAVKKEINRRSK